MKFNDRNTTIALRLREIIQRETETVGDGQGIAMALLWSFIVDDAENRSVDPEGLARRALEGFIRDVAPRFKMHRILRPPH